MRCIKKLICWLLAVSMIMGMTVSAYASDDPQEIKNYQEFGAPYDPDAQPEETEPAETEPAETESAETEPAETEPAETEPAETRPAETQPAETQPAETAPSAAAPEGRESEADEPQGHNGIPLYFQTDYPDNMFGVGTIASNGCAVTTLAMVATYMTGHEYLPDELARYFGGAAENNIARLEKGSETLQLAFYKSENWHKTLEALHDGKVAIALMGSDSIFTTSQHFIVLTGIDSEGRILVNDPFEPNYNHWNLKRGLREGFSEDAILLGYSGAWIYDKEAMPEEPFIYHEDLPERPVTRYDIHLTQAERDLLARVIWVEARGESKEGQQAVAEVVFNRMMSGHFPNTLHDVIYGEGQFRSVPFLEDAEPYQAQYEAIDNALYGPYILPTDVFYFATFPTTEKIWGKIGGHIFCYRDDSAPAEAAPRTKTAAEPEKSEPLTAEEVEEAAPDANAAEPVNNTPDPGSTLPDPE